MKNSAEKARYLKTSKSLVTFVSLFSQMLQKLLKEVEDIFEDTMSSTYKMIDKIADETTLGKNQAEQVLTETYIKPDEGTQQLVTAIQNEVDDIFEAAKNQSGDAVTDSSLDAKKRLRRFAGKFSKEMEAAGTIDDVIKTRLVEAMGNLSNDDVVKQNLEHLEGSISAFQVGLNYVLLDFHRRFHASAVEKLKKDLLSYTFEAYTSEEERQVFAECFPEEYEQLLKKAI